MRNGFRSPDIRNGFRSPDIRGTAFGSLLDGTGLKGDNVGPAVEQVTLVRVARCVDPGVTSLATGPRRTDGVVKCEQVIPRPSAHEELARTAPSSQLMEGGV